MSQRPVTTPPEALVAWARTALHREPAGARDLGDVAEACLDLTAADADALEAMLASGSSRVGELLRDAEARQHHLLRLRRFRLAVADLDDRGLDAGCLVAGVVDLGTGEGSQVPVLLKRCQVRVGGGDAAVTLHGPWRVNPALVDAVRGLSRGGVDVRAVLGGTGEVDAADPRPALDEVEAAVTGLQLAVRPRFVLAPVTLDGDRAVAALTAVADLVRTHPLLAAVPLPGVPRREVPASRRAAAAAPGPADAGLPAAGSGGPLGDVIDAAVDGAAAVLLDAAQHRAARLLVSGHHVVVEAPPATGASTVAVTAAVLAATTGKRCLLLAPNRAQSDVLARGVRAAGVGTRLLVAAETPPARPGEAGGPARPADAAQEARESAAAAFRDARDDLVRVRRPWQVSRLDALDALADLDGMPATVRLAWPGGEVALLGEAEVREAVEAVARAVELGLAAPEPAAAGPVRAAAGGASTGAAAVPAPPWASPWREAELPDDETSARALAMAGELAGPLGDRARDAVADLAGLTGTVEAATLADLEARRRLFTGLRGTLDKLTPEAFDIPVDDLVVATGPREMRRGSAAPMPALARRRLVARARRLVRPGVDVSPSELHELLASAARLRVEWQQIAGGAGWAHVPPDVPSRIRVIGEFLDRCTTLRAVHPGFAPTATIEEAVALARRLHASQDSLDAQPEIATLVTTWTALGLGPLVDSLVAQGGELPVDPGEAAEVVRTAMWQAYWAAVAEQTPPGAHATGPVAVAGTAAGEGAAGPRPAGPAADAGRGDLALARYETADAAQRAAAPGRASAALAALPGSWSVRAAVPPDLADVDPDERYDVVVVDDAGRVPFAEVVAALARSRQVVVLGDPASASADSALTLLARVEGPLVARATLDHRHRPVRLVHAAGAGADAGLPGGRAAAAVEEIPPGPGRGLVTFHHVPGASGLPAEGDDYVDTSEEEVAHVVERALELARAVPGRPAGSLAIVALTRAHAAAVALGLRTALRAAPERAGVLATGGDEPLLVVAADQARGLERDVVLLAVGFPRTPHGRVLHRFGPLESDAGAALVATAVTRARHELHVVSGLRAADLDPSRLRSEGARAVSALLAGAELAAGRPGPAVPAQRPPVPPAGGPRSGVEPGEGRARRVPGGGVLRLVARDLAERGLDVAADGQGLDVARTGSAAAAAVDLDVAFASVRDAARRRARLTEAGRRHVLVAVEDVAADRLGSLARVEANVPAPGTTVDVADPGDGPGSAGADGGAAGPGAAGPGAAGPGAATGAPAR